MKENICHYFCFIVTIRKTLRRKWRESSHRFLWTVLFLRGWIILNWQPVMNKMIPTSWRCFEVWRTILFRAAKVLVMARTAENHSLGMWCMIITTGLACLPNLCYTVFIPEGLLKVMTAGSQNGGRGISLHPLRHHSRWV